MGLDITAYRKLTPVNGNEIFDQTGELKDPEGWLELYVPPHFPGREDEIQDRHAYTYTASFSFCAGSYTGYNKWRNELAELAGYARTSDDVYGYAAMVWSDPRPGPFMELINFADNEGMIGAAVSAKLARDFAAFQPQANTRSPYFRQQYTRWRIAFEMAADGGAVDFH